MNVFDMRHFARLSLLVVFPFAFAASGCTAAWDDVDSQDTALHTLKPKKPKHVKPPKKPHEYEPPCGVDAGAGNDAGTEPDASGPPVVRGTFIDTYVVDNGAPQAKPRDLSGDNVVIRATAGQVSFVGVGQADGTFEITGVPLGTYTLQFDLDDGDATPALYLVTSERNLELGSTLMGRADRSGPSLPTQLAFSPAATGLAPWQDDHQLQFVSSNAGAFADLLAGVYANGPTVGATSLGIDVAWHTLTDGYLIDQARGDSALVTQLVPRTNASAVPHFTIARASTLAPFTLVDGATTSVVGTFSPVAQSQSVTLDWRRSQFDALKNAIQPGTFTIEHDLALRAQPGGLGFGYFTFNSPDLLSYYPGDVATDLNLGAVAYGNPFPASWGVVGTIYSIFATSITAPGADYPIDFYSIVSHLAPVGTFGAAAITPSLSPVTNPTIDGASAFVAQTLASNTPTLAWSAPAIGTADAYQVFIYRIDVNAGAPSVSYTGELMTRATSVTVPSGLLTAGNYLFYIRATRAPGVNLAATPRRLTLPYAVADAVTAVVVSAGSGN